MSKKQLLIIVLSVSIAIVMVVAWFTVGVFAASRVPILGDANGDRKINEDDIIKVIRISLGIDEPTIGADVDQDGEINVGDAIRVERQIYKYDPVYGDANGDLVVDQSDVRSVMRMYFGFIKKTAGADANRDGKINMMDVTAIQRMLLD